MATGTARRDRYRALADRIRAKPGRDFGLRPHTVTLVQTIWDDPDRSHYDETPILHDGQNPKVRFLTAEERYSSGLQRLSLEVGPITPTHAGGGYSAAQLNPELNGQESFHYLVTGPGMAECGSKFALAELQVGDSALGYRLILELSETGQPARPDPDRL